MKFAPLLALTTFIGLLACQANDSSDLSIYGGSPSRQGSWPSVVAITDSQGVFCSGTAIHPRVVVTAAHCVEAMTASQLYVYQGDGKSGGSFQGQTRVSRAAYSPKYGFGFSGYNDIAYLLLETPLALSSRDLIPVLSDADEMREILKAGTQTTLVGFGLTESQELGVKYETTSNISWVTDNEVTIGGSGHDACQGDSGGPAFAQLANGEWRVFGVVSRGPDCGSGGQWGLMNANICWIQSSSGIDLDLKGIDCSKPDSTPSYPTSAATPETPAISNEDEDDGNPYPGRFDYGDAYGGGYCIYFGGCYE